MLCLQAWPWLGVRYMSASVDSLVESLIRSCLKIHIIMRIR